MATSEPPKILGYTALTTEKVELVNTFKQAEELMLQSLDELSTGLSIDQRWLSIGRTHLEQAFMALNRAVMRPQRVNLEDGK